MVLKAKRTHIFGQNYAKNSDSVALSQPQLIFSTVGTQFSSKSKGVESTKVKHLYFKTEKTNKIIQLFNHSRKKMP